MKKGFIITLLALFTLSAQAQNTSVFKITPLKALNGKLGLSYERTFNEKASFVIGFQAVFPSSLNAANNTLAEAEFEGGSTFDNVNLDGFSRNFGVKVTPELRLYLSGNAPTGFYLKGFGRFTRSQVSWENIYNANTGEDVNYDFRFPTTIGGLGAGLGNQWALGENFVIDWNIGLGIGAMNIGVVGDASAPSAESINEFFTQIEEGIGTPFIDPVTENSVSRTFGSATIALPLVISRLSVGYIF